MVLINTGEPCRVRLTLPLERSVDVATGQVIARREWRGELAIGADEVYEVLSSRASEWADAADVLASENPGSGIRFVHGPVWDGAVDVAMHVVSAGDAPDDPGVPRRYRVRLGAAGRGVRLPVLDVDGVIHRPGAPTPDDLSILFYYWRWVELPVEELARRACRTPGEIGSLIGGAMVRRAGAPARPPRAVAVRLFRLLDARRRREPVDITAAAAETGLPAATLRRCLDLVDALDLAFDVDGATGTPRGRR